MRVSKWSTFALPLGAVAALAGAFREQRAVKEELALGPEVAAEQLAHIFCVGFREGAHRAVAGFTLCALWSGVIAALALFAGRSERRAGVLAGFVGCASAGAALAGAFHARAMSRAYLAASHTAFAPDLTTQVVANSFATARWWLLFGACSAGVTALAALSVSLSSVRATHRTDRAIAGAAWLTCLGVVAAGALHLESIRTRHAGLTRLAGRYHPPELSLIDVPTSGIRSFGIGLHRAILVGPRHLYWADTRDDWREFAAASILNSPSCAKDLKAAFPQEARLDKSSQVVVALDRSTSFAAMKCVIRALQRPMPPTNRVPRLPEDEPGPVETPDIEWLACGPSPELPRPFDVIAPECGIVRLAIASSPKPGSSVVRDTPTAAEFLRTAATTPNATLLLPDHREGLTSDTTGTASPAPTTTPAPSGSASPSASPVVRVLFGAPTITGRIDDAEVERPVATLAPAIEACYREGLARNPALEGRVQARFVIDREGNVNNVALPSSTLPDASVAHCIVRRFYGLHFQPSKWGIVVVEYPVSVYAVGAER